MSYFIFADNVCMQNLAINLHPMQSLQEYHNFMLLTVYFLLLLLLNHLPPDITVGQGLNDFSKYFYNNTHFLHSYWYDIFLKWQTAI
jgi:hypothetical protein